MQCGQGKSTPPLICPMGSGLQKKAPQLPVLRHWLPAVLLVPALYGCLTISTRYVTGLTPEERALAARLPVSEQRPADGSYEAVARVRGLSCQINQADAYRVSEENALEELKRATFRDGGNAVVGVRCETYSRGEGPFNCFRSILCTGEAVRLESTPAG